MIEVQGRIVAIHREKIRVAIEPDAHCAACATRKTCQGESGNTFVELPPADGLAVGDRISLGMEEATLARSALLAYLIPPVCLICGAGLGDAAGHSDMAAILGALAGLAAGLGMAWAGARLLRPGSLQPVISNCHNHTKFSTRSPAP